MPDSLPRARTRSPGLAGGDPLDSGRSRSRRTGPCPPAGGGGAGRGRTTRSEAWGWPVPPRRRWWPRSWASCRCGGWCAAACATWRCAPITAAAPNLDQVLQPGLEQTPEDLVVSKIGVGQDFPDQRGHGRLVRGGHRGCTPCESWSKNWGSHDAPTRADDPGRKPRGNCHHTKRRTLRGSLLRLVGPRDPCGGSGRGDAARPHPERPTGGPRRRGPGRRRGGKTGREKVAGA